MNSGNYQYVSPDSQSISKKIFICLDFNNELYKSTTEIWKPQKIKADVNNHEKQVHIYVYENSFSNPSTTEILVIEIQVEHPDVVLGTNEKFTFMQKFIDTKIITISFTSGTQKLPCM